MDLSGSSSLLDESTRSEVSVDERSISSLLGLFADSSEEKRPPEALRRTYVILTELDEPFFGPYPIEFTITI